MAQMKLVPEALGSGGMPLTHKRESLFQDAFRHAYKRHRQTFA